MSLDLVTNVYSNTIFIVGLILASGTLGTTLGWGLICAKTIEGLARQPEMKGELMTNTFLFGGLMEAFPFITLGIAMWFTFANPFIQPAIELAGG